MIIKVTRKPDPPGTKIEDRGQDILSCINWLADHIGPVLRRKFEVVQGTDWFMMIDHEKIEVHIDDPTLAVAFRLEFSS
jgi:hypothetical protein